MTFHVNVSFIFPRQDAEAFHADCLLQSPKETICIKCLSQLSGSVGKL